MTDNPHFLVYSEYGLSVGASVKIVDDLLEKNGIKFPDDKNKYKQEIIFHKDQPNEKKYTHSQLVNITRETGVCWPLQEQIDRSDSVFGGSFGMSSPNWHFDFTVTFAGYSKTLKGPFRNTPAEMELCADIEFYREEACYESDNQDFEMTFRNYRAYLFSSISLIDAYINRHIIVSKHNKNTSEDFLKLCNSRNAEERIELFLKVYTKSDISQINNRKEWYDFQLLREIRNEVIHSVVPYSGAGLKELALNLNYSKNGVGGLLKLLQDLQGKSSLGFIEKIRNAPKVLYNKVTLKADGNHEVQTIQSK